jgi:hypothetical protein
MHQSRLELKARDACLFLPPGLCTHCDVIEESAAHFVREATIAGSDIREIITLEPDQRIRFLWLTERSAHQHLQWGMRYPHFASSARGGFARDR